MVSGNLISKCFKNDETVIKNQAILFHRFLGFNGFNGCEGAEDRPGRHPQPRGSQIKNGRTNEIQEIHEIGKHVLGFWLVAASGRLTQ